jgi:hypothetical protein
MNSLWHEPDRTSLLERVRCLTPSHKARWGRMTPERMIVHLADAFRMALGELHVKPHWHPVRYPPFRQLMIYWVPMPKNVPTAPELVSRDPRDLGTEVADLEAMIGRFAGTAGSHAWADHPLFGPLTSRDWGVLMYRHIDHHFRQFGI